MDNEVFIKRSAKPAPQHAGLALIHLVEVKPRAGEIGIEIEVEGNKFPKGPGYELNDGDRNKIPSKWQYTHDGSLRGEDNAEYVLKNPIKFSQVGEAVTELWQMFSDYGSVLSESNRTSVHVHLNVQNFHLNRLCSFVAMYFVMEDLLTSWCGDHRVGNLFCLRAKDAPAIVRRLKEFFQKDGYGYQFSSGMHYAGLNPSAIHKFGSIEIRSLRGVNDPQVILDWVSVLERLYIVSAEFKDPRDVVAGFSGSGPIAWLQNLLGDKYSTIMNNVPYTVDEVRNILYEGVRLAQDLCYCRDWSEYKEKELQLDPFMRKSRALISDVIPSGGTFDCYASFTSQGVTYSNTSPSYSISPLPGHEHSEEYISYYVSYLYDIGQINTERKVILMSWSLDSKVQWLQNNGYLPQVLGTPEEEDTEDYEDDYGDFDPEDDD